jgi:hypothetical protein
LATVVELRNLQGRWEFLVEAFHGETRSSGTEPAGETRGRRDRVTITLRPQGGQEVALTVDERGRLSIGTAEAAMVLPGVAVRHRAFEDRWRARVILPADWLGQLRTGATAANQDGGAAADDARRPIVHLSIERRLGNGRRLSGPLVTAPWRSMVGTTIAVDLGAWDVLQPAP